MGKEKSAQSFLASSFSNGGHLKPITLKPVSRIFYIFRVFVSAFSAFSAFLLRGISSDAFLEGSKGDTHKGDREKHLESQEKG